MSGHCVIDREYVEAFHRVLKYIYLKGKVNKYRQGAFLIQICM